MATDAQAWEEQLIADVRAHGGRPSQGPLAGHPIMILYTIGAKTGERRRSIVTYSQDGDAYVITGTNGGNRAKHPSWLANINANPDVTFEIGDQTIEGGPRRPLARSEIDCGRGTSSRTRGSGSIRSRSRSA